MTPRPEAWGRVWFTSLQGWWNSPSSTGQTTQFLAADGGWNDRAYLTPRVIEIEGYVEGPDRASVRTGIETLMGLIPVDETRPLVVHEDGLARHCLVRMAGEPAVDWERGPDLAARWNIQLVASDPRKLAGDGFGTNGISVIGPLPLPSTNGGLKFPTTVPFLIDAEHVSGQAQLSTTGTAPPNVWIEFTGPVVRPGFKDVATGREIYFDLDLTVGQSLVVDVRQRTVKLNGVSRAGTRKGQWFPIPSGTLLEFTAQAYNNDARMTVRTQEAWR